MDEKIKEERNKAYDEVVIKGYVTDLDSACAFKLGFDEAVRIISELRKKEYDEELMMKKSTRNNN